MEYLRKAQQEGTYISYYPQICDLLKTDTNPEAEKHLEILVHLYLENRPALIIVVKGPPQKIWYRWNVESPHVFLENSMGIDGQIFVLSHNLVEIALPPTIEISP